MISVTKLVDQRGRWPASARMLMNTSIDVSALDFHLVVTNKYSAGPIYCFGHTVEPVSQSKCSFLVDRAVDSIVLPVHACSNL